MESLETSSRMISRSPDITRLLDKLIVKRVVRRVRSRQERRVAVISITPLGLELLDRMREHLAAKTVKELSLEKTKD